MATYEHTNVTRQLDDRQLELLSRVEQREIVDAFDPMLVDRGIPLRVRGVEFAEFAAVPAVEPIGPDPDVPPSDMPPPGGVYICWREVEHGPWVCISGNPTAASQ